MAKIQPIPVCLPGLDGTGVLFDDFLAEVPSGLERIVVRYPIHLSSYADILPLVRAAMPEGPRIVLIAESFSTPIAIKIAASAEGNLCGLVLCAGFASSPLRGVSRILASLLAPQLLKFEPGESGVKWLLAGRDASNHLVTSVLQGVQTVSPRVRADRLKQVLSCDVREELRKIHIPILYVKAKRDRLVGAACSTEILRCSREAKLVEIDGPHLILQREPRACAKAIIDFVHNL